MGYNDLMDSMDEGIEEKKAEIRKKAEEAAAAIRCDAKKRAGEIVKSRTDAAVLAAADERNRALYAAKNELNREMTLLKYRLLDRAFEEAGRSLHNARGSAGYAGCYRQLLVEALGELGDSDAVLQIDPIDGELCQSILAGLGRRCEVVPELQCAGGVNACAADRNIVIFNTLESRLEKAREHLKLDLFAVLLEDARSG